MTPFITMYVGSNIRCLSCVIAQNKHVSNKDTQSCASQGHTGMCVTRTHRHVRHKDTHARALKDTQICASLALFSYSILQSRQNRLYKSTIKNLASN